MLSIRTLFSRQKILQPNLHLPFFRTLTSILSEILYHPPFSNHLADRYSASQSDLWASIGRTNQNTLFNYPITRALHSSTNQSAPFSWLIRLGHTHDAEEVCFDASWLSILLYNAHEKL